MTKRYKIKVWVDGVFFKQYNVSAETESKAITKAEAKAQSECCDWVEIYSEAERI